MSHLRSRAGFVPGSSLLLRGSRTSPTAPPSDDFISNSTNVARMRLSQFLFLPWLSFPQTQYQFPQFSRCQIQFPQLTRSPPMVSTRKRSGPWVSTPGFEPLPSPILRSCSAILTTRLRSSMWKRLREIRLYYLSLKLLAICSGNKYCAGVPFLLPIPPGHASVHFVLGTAVRLVTGLGYARQRCRRVCSRHVSFVGAMLCNSNL